MMFLYSLSADWEPRNPTTGRAGCCARAANGHAAAALPSPAMNERLGGFEVHDHLEFCRKLNREIARLRPAQNAIDIGGGATPTVYLVDSIRKQTAVSGKGIPRLIE